MNIKIIRENLEKKVNKELLFKFNGGRNQIEEFFGKIDKLYNYIFTIKVNGNGNRIKSFSYNDVLAENLVIYQK